MPRLFTIASDDSLTALVRTASERLVIVTPGITAALGEALRERVARDGGPRILAVIVDVDPETCRLGFGDLAGMEVAGEALESRGLRLQTQEGVRIGLIVADAEVLVFTPTPRLIEAGSTSEEKPNAIRITEQGATDLALACGAGGTSEFLLQQEVGLDVVEERDVEAMKKDLEETPPRRFQLARLERVFNYKLEFVEFSLEHYKLHTRSVPLPAELLGLAQANLRGRLRNTFRVFATGSPFKFEIEDPNDSDTKVQISEKWLTDEAARLRKEYFIPLGSASYGNLILKRLKPEFEAGAGRLKTLVDAYAEKVRETIASKIEETRDELVKALYPRVQASPPASWLKRSVDGALSNDALKKRLEDEVDHAFAKVEQAFDPTLACVFKGVTYETITDDKHFRERMVDHFGEDEANKLLSEYDASRAQEEPQE